MGPAGLRASPNGPEGCERERRRVGAERCQPEEGDAERDNVFHSGCRLRGSQCRGEFARCRGPCVLLLFLVVVKTSAASAVAARCPSDRAGSCRHLLAPPFTADNQYIVLMSGVAEVSRVSYGEGSKMLRQLPELTLPPQISYRCQSGRRRCPVFVAERPEAAQTHQKTGLRIGPNWVCSRLGGALAGDPRCSGALGT